MVPAGCRRVQDRERFRVWWLAPNVVDVETVSVLRRRWLAKDLTEGSFRTAIDDRESLSIVRCPTRGLMRRACELRANLTAYNAAHVALAEGGPECTIQIVRA